jgi:hypothetical protein
MTNYTKSTSPQNSDLELSYQYSKQLYLDFCKIITFSSLAIDQAHEQTKANVKGDGDVVGIKEDSSALERRIIAGPKGSRLVNQYTSTS